MKKKKLILLPLVIIVVGALAIYSYMKRDSARESDIVRVSGNIEITDVQLSFKIAGYAEERLVSEGENVVAGQIIARLDDSELLQEVALRDAEVQAAQAELEELEAGSRPEEIAQAEAVVKKAQSLLDELLAGSRPQEVAAAEAAVESARSEAAYQRLENERHLQLYEDKVISSQEYEIVKTAYERAEARLKEAEEQLKLVKEGPRKEAIEQARASLKEAHGHYTLVKKGPRQETIDQARARLKKSKEALALAETQLRYATLVSPLSGVVLSENVESGEYVSPGTPIVTIGDLNNVWLRAYVNETELGRVKIGQQVRVKTDTYPTKLYEGHISFISSEAEFTPKNVQTEQERVKLVYRVKITVANPNMELKPGMPADAEIVMSDKEQ